MSTDFVLLRAAGTALLLDTAGSAVPRVLHWGADLGALTPDELAQLRQAATPSVQPSAADTPLWLTLLPGEAEGWSGHAGLTGHRDGVAAPLRWTVEQVRALTLAGAELPADHADGGQVLIRARDKHAGLAVELEIRLEVGGLVRLRHSVRNTGAGTWTLDGLRVLLPLPAEAGELLDLTGRWCRERSPQRQPFTLGTRLRAGRRGRTGHDAPLLLVAGTPGFGFRSGEVWGAHVAFSGDHVHLAERLPERAGQSSAVLGGGELVRPGEVRLAPDERYHSPWVCFAWSDRGLDGLSRRVHQWVRGRDRHPRTPRPLVVNTWEAVYFDHDLDRLRTLADTAARVGVELFVLDDGWFRHRRNDHAGLGDWTVDPEVWPQGLHPLVDHVRARGLRMGLWVEPEMVNLDSDLARAHPDWLLAAPGRLPLEWRHQHVLDVARPEVSAYLLECLDALVTEYRLDFLKWDHNRDLLEAVHNQTGQAGVHRQTLAVYALLDALRQRHPALEIESCSSGGGRVDLGVLEHTDRVWASDTNDPLERQLIQRWTTLLLPPELVGSHVGGPTAHTTGRVTDLHTRCLTSLFAHAGIEWDITSASEAELDQLTAWTRTYRELRPLLHSGDVVRADLPDPGALLHGVVAADRSEAAFAYVRLTTAPEARPGRVRLPGLDPDRRYQVAIRTDFGTALTSDVQPPSWCATGLTARGAVLGGAGLEMPALHPGQGLLLHVRPV